MSYLDQNDGLLEDAVAKAEFEGYMTVPLLLLLLETHEQAKHLIAHDLRADATVYPKKPHASGDA